MAWSVAVTGLMLQTASLLGLTVADGTDMPQQRSLGGQEAKVGGKCPAAGGGVLCTAAGQCSMHARYRGRMIAQYVFFK
ncbi:hypothetical protein BDP67DRAFT_537677 [Colletotrichum lupini]|nr:hypothetical protein BDP67DRAFT_537677 [Colletotrichum lupini]